MAVILVAGCGGGDETTTPSLTKAEYISQGDAICGSAYEERLAAIKPYIDNPDKELTQAKEEEIVVEEILPSFQRANEKLRELEPPPKDAEEIEAVIEAIEGAVERGTANPKSILAGASSQFGEAEKLAESYGFEVCGRS